jgi:peptidoglycan hydrolase-like protein with peptidoglycan-binding domain
VSQDKCSKAGDEPRGFAGLSAMASNVTASAPEAPSSEVPKRNGDEAGQSVDRRTEEGAGESEDAIYQTTPQPTQSSWKGLWVVGLALVVIWLALHESTTSAPPSAAALVSTSPAYEMQEQSAEVTPQIGTNKLLTGAEIQYCLAEDIRLGAAKAAVDRYVGEDVDRFNDMVADYNSRCSEFRYENRTMGAARTIVESRRAELEAAGRRRFPQRLGHTFDDLVTERARAIADPLVRQVQERLNALGYTVGDADGVIGSITTSAITAFQRDSGLTQDGTVTTALLDSLDAAKTRSSAAAASSPSAIPPPQLSTGSRDRANYQTCISGNYPTLCKHDLLTTDEAGEVAEAERRANLRTCSTGEYPTLCKHGLLTRGEAADVAEAERRVNLRTCSTGDYPTLCKHALLTGDEPAQVAAAERGANYRTCISGQYPSLCNHAILTAAEAAQVNSAELNANLSTCLTGLYPSLCKHALLTPDQARQVTEVERREQRR